jgi:hypothetical protein
MEEDELQQLRLLVVDDPALRQRLLAVRDRGAFVTEVVVVAHERSLDVAADDVFDAIEKARRNRRQRWV